MAIIVHGIGMEYIDPDVYPVKINIGEYNSDSNITYYVGDKLNIEGMTVHAIMNDGSIKDITNGITHDDISGALTLPDSTFYQKQSFNIYWTWKENSLYKFKVAYEYNVYDVINSATIVSSPTKTTYAIGETLNYSDMVVNVTNKFSKTYALHIGEYEVYDSDGKYVDNNSVKFTSGGEYTYTVKVRSNTLITAGTFNITVSPCKIVTWANGTDAEIKAMVDAADAGKIKLSDYWTVGDIRKINLSAMDTTGVGESHAAQSAEFVLMNVGGKTLSNGKECNFVVGMKNCLNETGYMNSSNDSTTGWDKCARRAWCNNVFYNAIPSSIRSIFKKCKNVTASTGGQLQASLTTSEDYFALPAEKEIFGDGYGYSKSGFSADSEANSSALTQFTWYKTASNRIKQVNGSNTRWWERSPDGNSGSGFCLVRDIGSASNAGAGYGANAARGLAPFGCI